jgi:hypothetical protein
MSPINPITNPNPSTIDIRNYAVTFPSWQMQCLQRPEFVKCGTFCNVDVEAMLSAFCLQSVVMKRGRAI